MHTFDSTCASTQPAFVTFTRGSADLSCQQPSVTVIAIDHTSRTSNGTDPAHVITVRLHNPGVVQAMRLFWMSTSRSVGDMHAIVFAYNV